MKKPCKVVGLEMLEDDEEKITFYFIQLETYADITISRVFHKKLFYQLVDATKDGLTIDFMDLDLNKELLK